MIPLYRSTGTEVWPETAQNSHKHIQSFKITFQSFSHHFCAIKGKICPALVYLVTWRPGIVIIDLLIPSHESPEDVVLGHISQKWSK